MLSPRCDTLVLPSFLHPNNTYSIFLSCSYIHIFFICNAAFSLPFHSFDILHSYISDTSFYNHLSAISFPFFCFFYTFFATNFFTLLTAVQNHLYVNTFFESNIIYPVRLKVYQIANAKRSKITEPTKGNLFEYIYSKI